MSNDAAQKDAQNKSSEAECAEGMEQKEHALHPMKLLMLFDPPSADRSVF